VGRSSSPWHLTIEVALVKREDDILSGDVVAGVANSEGPCSSSLPGASSVEITSLAAAVVDDAVMTWVTRSVEQSACTTSMVSLGTTGVTASDLSVARVGAVDAAPLTGSITARAPSPAAAAGSMGTASMVPSWSEEPFLPGSLPGTGSIETVPLVVKVNAGVDDGLATIVVELVAAWAHFCRTRRGHNCIGVDWNHMRDHEWRRGAGRRRRGRSAKSIAHPVVRSLNFSPPLIELGRP
jgi:hypothetical protein